MSGDVAVTSEKHWIPAESNDAVFTSYAAKLGWPTEAYSFQELLSFEPWAMEMFNAKEVKAVLLLYVVSKPQEEWRRAEQLKRDASLRGSLSAEELEKLPPADSIPKVDERVFHVAQNIDNACGTLGLIHAAANLSTLCGGNIALKEGSFLERYIRDNLTKTADERAAALDDDTTINEAHEAVAQEGQSAVVDDTHNHFVCFVRGADGGLYDLDGRKTVPFLMKTKEDGVTEETFFEQAMALVQEYMARDPEEVRFSMMVLAPPSDVDLYGEPEPQGAAVGAGAGAAGAGAAGAGAAGAGAEGEAAPAAAPAAPAAE